MKGTDHLQTILVDMDGPIAHFEQRVYEHMRDINRGWVIELDDRNFGWVANDYADRFGPEAEERVRDLCGAAGFFESLPVVEGAADALNTLVATGYNVRVCTSPALWNPTCASAKLEWLEREIGEGWAQRCIITKDKTMAYGQHLIDDKPLVEGSRKPDWVHILWETAYNQHPDLDHYARRVGTWDQVIEFFSPVATMPTVGGEPWRCECGGNVLNRRGNLYSCTACFREYEGE